MYLNNQVEMRDKLFYDMCPSYTNDPCAAAQAIRQVTLNEHGQEVVTPLAIYIDMFKRAIRPVLDADPAKMNYSQQLVAHLEEELKRKFEGNFKEHLTCTDMSRSGQMALLTKTCVRVRKENDELKVFERIIHKKTVEQNTMFNSLLGAAMKVDLTGKSSSDALAIFASQAERTIQNNSGPAQGMGLSKNQKPCWGCGQRFHQWYDTKRKEIVCPNKDQPGVRELAKANFELYKKSRFNLVGQPRKRRNVNGNTNTGAIVEPTDQQFAAPGASVTDNSSVNTGLTHGTGMVPQGNASIAGGVRGVRLSMLRVLNVIMASRLPIEVHPRLPHSYIGLGQADMPGELTPLIAMMLDSGAAINTYRLTSILALIERFPHILKSMTDCKDGRHQPLELAGIISNKAALDGVSTTLPVMIEVWTPYFDQNGEQVFVQFACGNDVSVNVILGMPFWRQSGLILDTVNEIATATNFRCDPFKLVYQIPSCGDITLPAPSLNETSVAFKNSLTRAQIIVEMLYVSLGR